MYCTCVYTYSDNCIYIRCSDIIGSGFYQSHSVQLLANIEPVYLLDTVNRWREEEGWTELVSHCLYNVLLRERSKVAPVRATGVNLATQAALKGGVAFHKESRVNIVKQKARTKLVDILDKRNGKTGLLIRDLIERIDIVLTPDGLYRLKCPTGCNGQPCFRPITDPKSGLIRTYKDGKVRRTPYKHTYICMYMYIIIMCDSYH